MFSVQDVACGRWLIRGLSHLPVLAVMSVSWTKLEMRGSFNTKRIIAGEDEVKYDTIV